MATRISYSRFSTYLRCPYAHYLRYVEHISSKSPCRPLHFGSDFHKLLEVRTDKAKVKKEWRRMRDEFYSMPGSWQSELGENYPEDLKTIFQDYLTQWKGTPLPTATEQSFEIKVDKDILFIGVIDEIYKDSKGYDLGEHKTFSVAPNMNTLVMNSQKCLYCKASQLLSGELPRKVKWDYIKSTPAKYPIWLEKSGRFSTAASKDITLRSWLRACKERGIEDPEILKQGEIYKGNENNFFFRIEQDVYPEMVENIYEGFLYTSKDIANNGHKNTTKNVTKDCNWCEYRDICMAEFSNGDREYVISEAYSRKD